MWEKFSCCQGQGRFSRQAKSLQAVLLFSMGAAMVALPSQSAEQRQPQGCALASFVVKIVDSTPAVRGTQVGVGMELQAPGEISPQSPWCNQRACDFRDPDAPDEMCKFQRDWHCVVFPPNPRRDEPVCWSKACWADGPPVNI